jgi:hypothetical protein
MIFAIKLMKIKKKEYIHVLDKFMKCLHGENFFISFQVMEDILKIGKADGLNELKKLCIKSFDTKSKLN